VINPDTLTALLQTLADWRDDLRTQLDSADHTVPAEAFQLLRAEVRAFKRISLGIAKVMESK
jgi:hypothetical protein